MSTCTPPVCPHSQLRRQCPICEAEGERDAMIYSYRSLKWQVDNEGCAVSREGEATYECRPESKCGLCRLRGSRDALQARIDAALDALRAVREALDPGYSFKDAATRNKAAMALLDAALKGA